MKTRYTVADLLAIVALAPTDKDALAQLTEIAPSRNLLRGMRKVLTTAGKPACIVDSCCQALGVDLGPRTMGRSRPMEGEVRRYSAQQLKEGGAFIRLPLDALGVNKGEEVEATFEADVIHVSRPPTAGS